MSKNESVDKLIESSGIITHHKVINKLREQGWHVLISPFYYDNIVNNIREIDIIAEKQFNSGLAGDSDQQINVQLFLECKYIIKEIIFWFDDKNESGAVSKLEKDTGLRILHGRTSADITPDKFHYLSNQKVAKLFSTNTNKEDVIYKAITQCLNSEIYYDQWSNNPIHFSFSRRQGVKTAIIKYPVIICDNFDKLQEVNFTNGTYEHKNIKDFFQLEINYTYLDKTKTRAITENFWIDIVNFNDLDSFIGVIEKEAREILMANPDN